MPREAAYIREFKDATKKEPTEADLKNLENEMYGASDRTAVITLVAYLERIFGRYIRSFMRENLSSEERRAIFDFNGPLGTFSSQIAIGYGWGAIGPLTRDDLQLFRIIRNGAAHSPLTFSFDAPEVINICKALQYPDRKERILSASYIEKMTGETVQVGTKFDDDSSKTRFNCSVHSIALSILKPVEPKRVALVIPFYLP